MQDLESFKELLSKPRRIVITTHPKPDADALGSSLGLANYLLKKGNQVAVISPTDYPDFLKWMKGDSHVVVYEGEQNVEKANYLVENADIIFCLDFSQLSRIEKLGEKVRESEATKVTIDHHLNPEDFSNFLFWSTKAAATCELVYELIDRLGDKDVIDKDIAECLYAGIMTDTGSFKHPNTTSKVHLTIAELIGLGADISKVSKLIYDNNSLNRLRFIGFALSEKLVVLENLHVAYFAISKDDLSNFSSKTGDTEGLVNYGLSIKGIVMAVTIIEREDKVKLSFRSVGDFPVNEFAMKHFNGGGHKNASGGISDKNFEETIVYFNEVIQQYKDQLTSNNIFANE